MYLDKVSQFLNVVSLSTGQFLQYHPVCDIHVHVHVQKRIKLSYGLVHASWLLACNHNLLLRLNYNVKTTYILLCRASALFSSSSTISNISGEKTTGPGGRSGVSASLSSGLEWGWNQGVSWLGWAGGEIGKGSCVCVCVCMHMCTRVKDIS